MINISVFIFTWITFTLYGNFKRLPELFPSALFASYLALFTDILMEKYELWSYIDAPLSGQAIKLLLGFGLYPIVGYLFMQFLPESLWKKLIYTFFWTLFAITFEFVYLSLGIIEHHMWWTLWMSYISDWIIFFLIYLQYCFYARPKFRGIV